MRIGRPTTGQDPGQNSCPPVALFDLRNFPRISGSFLGAHDPVSVDLVIERSKMTWLELG